MYEAAYKILVLITYAQIPLTNAHVDVSRGAKYPIFGPSLYLHSYFVYVSRGGSGDSSEPSLLADAISTKFSCTDPYGHVHFIWFNQEKININKIMLGLIAIKPVFGGVCQQQRSRPACTSAQTYQRLCFLLIGKYHISTCFKLNFNVLAILCKRFCHDETHAITVK